VSHSKGDHKPHSHLFEVQVKTKHYSIFGYTEKPKKKESEKFISKGKAE